MDSPSATMILCEVCGELTEKTSGNQKYCPDCRTDKYRTWWKSSKKRRRAEGYAGPQEVVEVSPTGMDALLMAIVSQALLDYSIPKYRDEAGAWLRDRGQEFVLATGGNENVEDMMEAIDETKM